MPTERFPDTQETALPFALWASAGAALMFRVLLMTERGQSRWTFLTNHGHVLVYVANHPDAKVREISDAVGVTDRATQTILGDLVDGGYVTRERVGRRNTYQVHPEHRFRHPAEDDHRVGELLRIFTPSTAKR